MKTLQHTLAVALMAIGMAGAAQAQDARAEHHAEMQAKMAEHWTARQAKLHDALKITTQQEAAWAAFQAAIKPVAPTGAPPDRAAMKTMTAPQRLEAQIAMTKQHEAAMENHLAALKTFYAALTPEQQAIMDKAVAHHMGGRMGHRGPMMHG